jgi:hypothetical protein
MKAKVYAIELLQLMAMCKTDHERCLILVAQAKDLSENIDDEGETWEYWNEIGKFIKWLKDEYRQPDTSRNGE